MLITFITYFQKKTSTTMVVGEAQEQNIIFKNLKKKGRDSSGYLK